MSLNYKKRASLVDKLNGDEFSKIGFLGNEEDDNMDRSHHFESERNYYKGQVYLHMRCRSTYIKIPISDDQLIDIAKQIIQNDIERANELQECLIIKDVDNA